MTTEQATKIGAFQQFDRKLHEQQGLGLGLLLVQRLIAQYRAKMEIISEPGRGTRVQITFVKAKESV
jgi:signal transduction histidine kinase